MRHVNRPTKMNKDISPHNYPNDQYFELNNGRIVSGDSQTSFSVSSEKGVGKLVSISSITNEGGSFRIRNENGLTVQTVNYTNPELYNLPSLSNLRILKFSEIRDRIFVFTCSQGYGQIWEYVEGALAPLQLLYYNNLDWSIDDPIRRVIPRFENEQIQKLYVADGKNYLRFFNTSDSDLINTPLEQIDVFAKEALSKPELIQSLPGGNFQPGYVQYAYNLYDINGSETKISTFSDMFTINPMSRGGREDESISESFKIRIDGIDSKFSLINVYRIYYTGLNSQPEVSLIFERSVGDSIFEFVDDNNLIQSSSTLENILFIGSDPFVPQDMGIKDNYMFPINIEYDRFDVDFDTRAYSFDTNQNCTIQDNSEADITFTGSDIINGNVSVPEEYDCINPSIKAQSDESDYQKYAFTASGLEFGATGLNVGITVIENEFIPDNTPYETNLQLNQQSYLGDNQAERMSLKRDENYRFFIRFEKNGQKSFSKWICDLRMPNQDTHPITKEDSEGNIVFVNLGVRVSVNNLPSDITGWEVLREHRSESNKTIKGQGFLNTMIQSPGAGNAAGGPLYAGRVQSSYITRTYHDNSQDHYFGRTFDDLENLRFEVSSPEFDESYRQFTFLTQFHSPEVEYYRENFNITESDYFNLVGGIENYYSETFIYNDSRGDIDNFESFGKSTKTNPSFGMRGYFFVYNSGQHTIIPSDRTQTAFYSSTNFRTCVRKGGSMNSQNIAKLYVFGEPFYTPEATKAVADSKLLSYDWGYGTQEFFNSTYLNGKDVNNNFRKFAAENNKCITFTIDYYGNDNGLEKKIENNGNPITSRNNVGKFIIADYKTPIANQYGGNTFEARTKNNPVVVSDLVSNSTSTEVFNGDTYISYWNTLRMKLNDRYKASAVKETIIIPLETSINQDLRFDEENFNTTELKNKNTIFSDYELPLDVYNRKKTQETGAVEPLNFQNNNLFTNRILSSNSKINGELKDSWCQYRENNYMDVNGSYGEAITIEEDGDELYVFQPEAVCQLLINPRVQTQSQDNISIQLGLGTLLYDYRYLTTNSGSINHFAVKKTPYGIFYFDLFNKKINLLRGSVKSISDEGGLHSYLSTEPDYGQLSGDNPFKQTGISSYYDREDDEIYFSFMQIDLENAIENPTDGDGNSIEIFPKPDNSFTLSYSNLLGGFHKIYNFGFPEQLESRKGNLLTNINLDTIYLEKDAPHGFYFDKYEKTRITYIVSPDYLNNIFDTLFFNASDKITGIRVYNNHQDTGLVSPVDAKRKFREWRVNIPREEDSRNRIMSQYVYITLEYQNDGNPFFIQDVVTNYRQRPASFV